MIYNKNLKYIIIILFLPLQYQFENDYSIQALEQIKSKNNFYIPNYQRELNVEILYITSTVFAIISIFIYYKIKKRRKFISICFIFNAAVWLGYLGFNKDRIVLATFLRILNGICLSFFHSITVSYLFYFVSNDYCGFYGYLIQTVMFLVLVIVYLLFSYVDYKMIAVILAIHDIIISCLFFFFFYLKFRRLQKESHTITYMHVTIIIIYLLLSC